MTTAALSTDAEGLAPGISGPIDERAELCRLVEQHLAQQGFALNNGRILTPVLNDKERLRALHAEAVIEQRNRAENTLKKYEHRFIHRIACGNEINVADIDPAPVLVTDRRSFESALWRWCALHWSIPVSNGYGRRLRFLVIDRAHGNKVIGLIGLADPVFGMKARDEWIGWNWERRKIALTNVMDAFVLGAVPPYNELRAGKLIALLATSDEVRQAFHGRYGERRTLISQRNPHAHLALITTTSAFGRSSVYNRLQRPDKTLAFQSVGYTGGSGDFHLSGAIYIRLMEYAKRNGLAERTQRHERWPGYEGGSPRSRRAVFDCALTALGFDPKALRLHGVRRQVFVAPLIANAPAFLTGNDREPDWITLSNADLSAWWRNRWANSRARRDDTWRDFDPESWRLWPQL